MTSAIQVRIDPKLKKQAMKILRMRGHTMSGFIKIVLGTMVSTQEVPDNLQDPLYAKAAARLKEKSPKYYTLEEVIAWNNARDD